jgi:CRISPR-associated endonuclease/helicase Cas3
MTFDEFFLAATGNAPFAWQSRLALEITQGDVARVDWPDVCALPTATGKTSLILIGLYALAMHPEAHRRIAYVMDRRIVVDATYELAKDIRDRLADPEKHPGLVPFAALLRARLDLPEDAPLLEAHLLRGGLGEPLARLTSPLTPTILVGTVDQLGSRLLFRGYGVSEGMRPISAGLLSHDTLWILDEAHLSRPFAETLQSVVASVATTAIPGLRPLQVIEVSATPRATKRKVFKLGIQDAAIKPRLDASKPVTLVDGAGKTADKIVRLVTAALANGKRRVGVIVNRVLLAREIFTKLKTPLEKAGAERLLLIGPIRGTDRDALYGQASIKALSAKADADFERPIVAVCTQTVEVGADLDFDALIVQSAPLDVLRQRFGRLDRTGKRPGADGAIVYETDPAPDFLYGRGTPLTMRWLGTIAAANVIDFGVNAFQRHLDLVSDSDLKDYSAPAVSGEPLDARHIRNLARTNTFADSPDVGIFLHAEAGGGDVQLVWRNGFEMHAFDDDAVAALRQEIAAAPPCSRETLTVSLAAARAFLSEQPGKSDTSDAGDIASADEEPPPRKGKRFRPALRWHADPERISIARSAYQLRPGDTLILPSRYGGNDKFGWAPSSDEPVDDFSVEAYVRPRRALEDLRVARALRLRLELPSGDSSSSLESRVRDALLAASFAEPIGLRAEIAGRLLANVAKVALVALDGDVVWVTWRGAADEDGTDVDPDASSFTREVSLVEHLDHVGRRARVMAVGCGLSDDLIECLGRAGDLHDIGKADERFQIILRGGDIFEVNTREPLGKGLRHNKGRKLLGLGSYDRYPQGQRHELVSAAMIPDEDVLLRHLVGTHHGRGRPEFPIIVDLAPRRVAIRLGAVEYSVMSDAQEPAGQWAAQFETLLSRYGAWGLAYLEAILRLADHSCSADEEKGDVDAA